MYMCVYIYIYTYTHAYIHIVYMCHTYTYTVIHDKTITIQAIGQNNQCSSDILMKLMTATFDLVL